MPAAALLAEARAAAALSHPNVCIIHAVDEQGAPMIVMEYVDGRPLPLLEAERLSPAAGRGPRPADRTRNGGGHAPGGRPRRPEAGQRPGHARRHGQGRGLRHGSVLLKPVPGTADGPRGPRPAGISGTPSYMAPEQARGEAATPASDVFSLGVMLYELATGKRTVTGSNVLEVLRCIEQIEPQRDAAQVPEPFAAVLGQGRERPVRRTITMAKIAELLEPLGLSDLIIGFDLLICRGNRVRRGVGNHLAIREQASAVVGAILARCGSMNIQHTAVARNMAAE